MTSLNIPGLPSLFVENLSRMGITTPTPIQAAAIPIALEGRDVLASAATGTGKTMAYLLPLLTKLLNAPQQTGLILAPTRELAMQVQEAVRELMGPRPVFSTVLLIGGKPMGNQLMALRKRPRLVIGTPGRICDHLNRQTLPLENAHFFVLDETDRMLDMGFTDAINTIVRELPASRQTFMFSATLPSSILKLAANYLTNPERITIGTVSTPSVQVTQEKIDTTLGEKFPHLLQALSVRNGSAIIFVRTQRGADRLAEKLNSQGQPADAIHGGLTQRKREQVIHAFRHGTNGIMVATDIAARGIDVPHVRHVINYDIPECPEDYIHRIGRTGRAGLTGHALSLVSPEENRKWAQIHRLQNGQSADSEAAPARGKRRSPAPSSARRPFREGSERRPLRSAGSEPHPYEDRPPVSRNPKQKAFHGGEPSQKSEGSGPGKREWSQKPPYPRDAEGGAPGKRESWGKKPYERDAEGGAPGKREWSQKPPYPRDAEGSAPGKRESWGKKPYGRDAEGGAPAKRGWSQKPQDKGARFAPKPGQGPSGKSFPKSGPASSFRKKAPKRVSAIG
jgi:ATP-dependent RNA helicase DeaD